MPQRAKGARLYLRTRKGRDPTWVILDGANETSTSCARHEAGKAEEALARYIQGRFKPNVAERDPAQISVAEVLIMYRDNFAVGHACPKLVDYHLKPLKAFWRDKSLIQVKGSACRAYVERRVSEGRKPETARRELETLQAAIRRWHKESPLDAVPSVTLPPKGVPRQRYLERWEAAALLRAARKLGAKHVARFILIGLYTGTRHTAIVRLGWSESLSNGSVDLSRNILYRRGRAERETNKRRPACALPRALRAFCEKWSRSDGHSNIQSVIHWNGKPIAKMKRAWKSVVREAGLGVDVTPHVLRHTFISWALWAGKDIWTVAGEAGTSALMNEKVYGHHREAWAKLGPEKRTGNAR